MSIINYASLANGVVFNCDQLSSSTGGCAFNNFNYTSTQQFTFTLNLTKSSVTPANFSLLSIVGKDKTLTFFPMNIFTLYPKLDTLVMGHVKMKTFKFASALSKPLILDYLELSYTLLDTINPLTMAQFTKLTYLKLDMNKIKTIPQNAFDKNVLLTSLYIGGNGVSSVQVGAFKNLTKLRVLALDYNNITTLPKNLFKNNANLDTLYLNNNLISTIDKDFAGNMTRLSSLYLSNNKIKDLGIDMNAFFNKMPKLYTMFIEFNDFKCSFLTKMIDQMVNRSINTYLEKPEKTKSNYYGFPCTN